MTLADRLSAWAFAQDTTVVVWSALVMLVASLVLFSRRHARDTTRLSRGLAAAQERVRLLELELAEADDDVRRRRTHPSAHGGEDAREPSSVRIWMDGAFDMMHFGHINAFRQGRALGTHLVVGVNDDESITRCKGPPVMTDQERISAVASCKFVDEVVPGVPYVMDEEYLKYVVEQYRIDFVVHGDDPCIVDGRDVYASAKTAGKYRTIPRTEGVSTTDIVGRMLLSSTEHHATSDTTVAEEAPPTSTGKLVSETGAHLEESPLERRSSHKFLATSRMLRLFSVGVREPPAEAVVVYIAGAWDMFHAGHTAILQRARQLGNYLIVGVHNDQLVNKQRGANMPIMNLQERVLSVLGCRFADDVLIDAPRMITREMLVSLDVSAVVCGTRGDSSHFANTQDPYAVPKQMGIFHEIDSASDLSVMEISGRIRQNQALFEKKYRRKSIAEAEYYDERASEKDAKRRARALAPS